MSKGNNNVPTKNVALIVTDRKATADLPLVAEPKAAVDKWLRTANSGDGVEINALR